MASESESPEIPSSFERFLRQRDMSLFLPFILGLTNNISRRQTQESPDEESPDQTNPNTNDRIILINPFTQGMVIIEGASSLDSLLRNMGGDKDGQPPASKASVAAMPSFKVGEEVGDESWELGECAVCLEEYGVGDVAREMPCKHRFHGECIEKWLGIHGSCPVCRYKMPVDEEDCGSKRDGVRREFWVSFSFRNGEANSPDSNQNETTATATATAIPPPSDSVDVSSPNSNPSADLQEPDE